MSDADEKLQPVAAKPVKADRVPQGAAVASEPDVDLPYSTDLAWSPKMVAGICGGLLIFAIGIYLVAGGGDDDNNAPSLQPSAPALGGLSTPGGPAPAGPAAPAPGTPKPITPALGAPAGAPTDDFDGPDGSLGEPWQMIGTWERTNGRLILTEAVEGTKQFAVRSMGSGDGAVYANAVWPSPTGGLVFRYVDPQNYWQVVPVAAYAAWSVSKVVDGEVISAATLTLSNTDPSTGVRVEMEGPQLRFFVDDQLKETIEDPTHASAQRAGFVVTVDRVSMARWDDFYAVPA